MSTSFARTLRLLAGVLALLGSALVPVLAAAPPQPTAQPGAEAGLELGADLFYRRCSVCHGKTGLGLEEARSAFPEGHRRCTQCHKAGGPEVMVVPFQDNHMFDVGDPPALRGPGTLPAFTDAAALRRYIQAAMPRHAPGSLTEAEAAAITALLTELRTAPAAAKEALQRASDAAN
jgi:mono/diheme cytochrome c family protein